MSPVTYNLHPRTMLAQWSTGQLGVWSGLELKLERVKSDRWRLPCVGQSTLYGVRAEMLGDPVCV